MPLPQRNQSQQPPRTDAVVKDSIIKAQYSQIESRRRIREALTPRRGFWGLIDRMALRTSL